MRKFAYYFEIILGIGAIFCLFLAIIGVMFCLMRNDMKFAWITTTLAVSALTLTLLKIYLFND